MRLLDICLELAHAQGVASQSAARLMVSRRELRALGGRTEPSIATAARNDFAIAEIRSTSAQLYLAMISNSFAQDVQHFPAANEQDWIA